MTAVKTIVFTTNTQWTVPGDWNNQNNSLVLVGGAGQGGAGGAGSRSGDGSKQNPFVNHAGGAGGGAGSGGMDTVNNAVLQAGQVINVVVGRGGFIIQASAQQGGNGSPSKIINTTATMFVANGSVGGPGGANAVGSSNGASGGGGGGGDSGGSGDY